MNNLKSIVFAKIPDPICILEKNFRKFLETNEAFTSLTGYSYEELQNISLLDIVYKRDLKNLEKRLSCMHNQHLRGELRILSKSRVLKELEIAIQALSIEDEEIYICIFRDIGSRKELERQLRQKLSRERQKVIDTAKSLLQGNHLMEKIHSLPVFFKELWESNTLSDLAKKTVSILCHPSRFNYACVSFFLIDGNMLKLEYSNRECALKRFNLQKQHRFAQVARNEKNIMSDAKGEYVLPIISNHGVEGVIQIIFQETERVLFEQSQSLKKKHMGVLQTIVKFLGDRLAHLHAITQEKSSSNLDILSNCSNRSYFFSKLHEYIEAKNSFVLLLIDIDKFHRFSLQKGDEQIQYLCDILAKNKPKQSILARTGDDEFAILAEPFSIAEAIEWTKEIRKHLKKNNMLESTISMGIASLDNLTPSESIWFTALSCLKKAKERGGNKIFYSENGVQKPAERMSTKLK